jgi:hypothetical protein
MSTMTPPHSALARRLGAILPRRHRTGDQPRPAATRTAGAARRATRLLAALTLLSAGLGSARLGGVAYADTTQWITQTSGWIGPD